MTPKDSCYAEVDPPVCGNQNVWIWIYPYKFIYCISYSIMGTVRLRVVLPSDFPVAERPCLPCFQPKKSARFSPPHSESPGGHTDGSLVWIISGFFWSSDRQKSTRNFMINLTIDRWKLMDGLTFDRWINLTNLTIDTHAVPSGIHASQGQLL